MLVPRRSREPGMEWHSDSNMLGHPFLNKCPVIVGDQHSNTLVPYCLHLLSSEGPVMHLLTFTGHNLDIIRFYHFKSSRISLLSYKSSPICPAHSKDFPYPVIIWNPLHFQSIYSIIFIWSLAPYPMDSHKSFSTLNLLTSHYQFLNFPLICSAPTDVSYSAA